MLLSSVLGHTWCSCEGKVCAPVRVLPSFFFLLSSLLAHHKEGAIRGSSAVGPHSAHIQSACEVCFFLETVRVSRCKLSFVGVHVEFGSS
eukprot:scaffold287601_cov22-Tisochrysis_lutea.AAC.1